MLFLPAWISLTMQSFSPAVARYAQKCIGKRQSLSKEYHTVRFLSIRKHEVCAYQRLFPKKTPAPSYMVGRTRGNLLLCGFTEWHP